MKLLIAFWRFARGHQHWMWVALLLLPLGTMCQLAGPLIIKQAVDMHLSAQQLSALRWDAVLFLLVILGEYVARAGERFCLIRWGILTLQAIRTTLMQHLVRQPIGFFERRPLGALVSRVTTDVEALMETLSSGVMTLASDIFVLAGMLCVMLYLSWPLTLVAFGIVIPLLIVIDLYRRRLRKDYERIRKHTGHMNGILNETIAGAREVQLFGYQAHIQDQFDQSNRAYFKDSMRVVGLDAILYSLVEGVGIFAIAAMAWYGVEQVLSGAISIGVLIAFLTYLQRFYTPLKEFSSKLAVLQGGLAAMERVTDLLSQEEALDWGTQVAVPEKAVVAFQQVWFGYPQRQEQSGEPTFALEDVSFQIQPGERVALVGATGSGKSTIAKLMTGLLQPTQGQVLIGEKPVHDYAHPALQQWVGLVPQEVALFSESIRFNLDLGNPEIPPGAIEQACQIVQAEPFIQRLQKGYNTVLDPDGQNLSQGQRQLLAFARILVWSPELVILDEATASVDSHSEQLIQAAILEVLERKTTLVIAHRLSTLQAVDRILVLDQGRLVEQGSHEMLLEQDGVYSRLLQTQWQQKAV